MWFFSSDPSKNFAYEIGEKVSGQEDASIWALHKGKHKTKGNPVSIFIFDIKGSSESQVQLAKASFKKIKTLRHPNILTYVDGLETDKVLYVVTEAVTPLEEYLRENNSSGKQNDLAISWGLHQIAKGLSFLINDCGFIHNNVCISSVFVDQTGEWRLGGVDYMYPATGPDAIPPVKILPALEKYDPPEKSRGGKRAGEKWSTDSWGLGCLIWEIYNGTLPKATSLKTLGKIPKLLMSHYGELVGADPRSRPNPSAFIEHCRHRAAFMDNKFVDTMLFLEEIQIKDQAEKTAFFNSLAPSLDLFPAAACKMRILPQLLHAFEYGNAGSAVLTPLFKIGKSLDAEEYQARIVPCIVKLFSSTDRATRVKLLQQIGEFVEFLSPDIVNGQIFPNVIQGFLDTNPVVREHTIKSMLHMAPKLNYKNLNEELLKHFARLQAKDDQGGIRTNTTVCLGKIACHLNPQIRQKVLSSAYVRALKDPFPPSRQAGILALAATHHFFTLKECALRLLPTLCSLTMDPDKGVREQAFKAIRCYLAKLEKVSENPEMAAEMEKDVNSGGSSVANAGGWTGWAVSGMSSIGSITSKIYKGKTPPPASHRIGEIPSKAPAKPSQQPTAPSAPSAPSAPPATSTPSAPPPEEEEEPEREEAVRGDNWDNSGWEDTEDWGDMNDTKEKTSDDPQEEATSAGDGWGDEDDDNWGAIDETPQQTNDDIRVKKESSPWGAPDFSSAENTSGNSTSAYNWGNPDPDSDDFFSTLISDDKKTSQSKRPTSASKLSLSSKSQSAKAQPAKPTSKPAAMSSSKSGGSEGWDDWGGADTTPQPQSTKPAPKSAAQPSSTKPAPKSSAQPPSTKPAPKATAQKKAAGWDDSGWGNDGDGWGNEEWGSMDDAPKSGMNKADEAKRLREEKKAQRQKELEQKRAARGAMKLGAKKLAAD